MNKLSITLVILGTLFFNGCATNEEKLKLINTIFNDNKYSINQFEVEPIKNPIQLTVKEKKISYNANNKGYIYDDNYNSNYTINIYDIVGGKYLSTFSKSKLNNNLSENKKGYGFSIKNDKINGNRIGVGGLIVSDFYNIPISTNKTIELPSPSINDILLKIIGYTNYLNKKYILIEFSKYKDSKKKRKTKGIKIAGYILIDAVNHIPTYITYVSHSNDRKFGDRIYSYEYKLVDRSMKADKIKILEEYSGKFDLSKCFNKEMGVSDFKFFINDDILYGHSFDKDIVLYSYKIYRNKILTFFNTKTKEKVNLNFMNKRTNDDKSIKEIYWRDNNGNKCEGTIPVNKN